MIQVMKFGVRRFLKGGDVVSEQSWKAHRYYNALIEIERDARQGYREIRARYVPGLNECEAELAEVETQIEGVYDDIRLTRQQASAPRPPDGPTPTKTPATPEQEAELGALRERRKGLSERARELRAQFDELVRQPNREFDRRTSGISRELADAIDEARAAVQAGGRSVKRLKAKKARTDVEATELEALEAELPAAKAQLKKLAAQKKAIAPSTHKKGAANARVLDEMLDEDWHPAWKETARLAADKSTRAKQARAECGLSTGTYLATEDALQRACKAAHGDPEFRRWEGGRAARKVGKQVSGEVLMRHVLAGQCKHTQVLSSERTRHLKSTGNRARHHTWVVAIDLGKGLGVVEVEVAVHRPVPPDARLRWLYLVPDAGRWTLQLTLELEKPLIERAPGRGTVHVDFRWSLTEDGGLVAALANGKPITVPPAVAQGLDFARKLRGYSDQHFDAARAVVQAWLKAHGTPEWLEKQVEHIAKWRAHGKLASISRQWLEQLDMGKEAHSLWQDWKRTRLRKGLDLLAEHEECAEWLKARHVEGERALAVYLDWWRRKDAHLTQMADGRRRRLLRRRKDLFRSIAARLSTEYERVEFGPLKIAIAARRKTPDRDRDELHQAARRQRVWAAPGELKECLVAAFGRERSGGSETPGSARAAENSLESGTEAAAE